ncbi:hypothetical protein GQ600_3194 [Phytophthora cactorum]|nr:hypothetical protein GQ600_3194 [Phytophthora cactorum]
MLNWKHHLWDYNQMADSLANRAMDARNCMQVQPLREHGSDSVWARFLLTHLVTLVTGCLETTMRVFRDSQP